MKFFYYGLALIAGLSLSLEGAIFGVLGQSIGQLETSFYNFAFGSVILGLLWLFFGKGRLSAVRDVPRWNLIGGLLGVTYLTAIIVSIPFVGVGFTMVTVIIGQLLIGMLIEHMGWLGSNQSRINRNKLCAIASMAVALFFIM